MRYDISIKQLREAMFVSQSEFARILGVSVVSVNRWETGKFEPTIKTKRRLNELFIEYKIKDKI
ncbi:MAG TPA: helix-turn-helix domain-containing protein [Gallicola sp.]|jgi:DNA-binding transcriptional regulator YiaG|nr:helix-turn-helix domain-containing protein [Gallicola sp.]